MKAALIMLSQYRPPKQACERTESWCAALQHWKAWVKDWPAGRHSCWSCLKPSSHTIHLPWHSSCHSITCFLLHAKVAKAFLGILFFWCLLLDKRTNTPPGLSYRCCLWRWGVLEDFSPRFWHCPLMARFPHCCWVFAFSSSPRTGASVQLPTCVSLLAFTQEQAAVRMFHIRQPQILQGSFITASSALQFMLSLTHLSWSMFLPKLFHCRRSPMFGSSLHQLQRMSFAGDASPCCLLQQRAWQCNSCSDQVAFHTCSISLSCWLLSSTLPSSPVYLPV